MRKVLVLLMFGFVCLSANAQITFQKAYGGTGYNSGNSVQQTTDGGYIITGESDNYNQAGDVYLIKTNPYGDTLWTKTYGGPYFDWGNSVQQTTDGGYIIAGGTKSFGIGANNLYLIKTNSTGDTLWSKTYSIIVDDFESSIQQTTDGGYIITGYTYTSGLYSEKVYLIKTNSIGDTLWTKTYGGTNYDQGNYVRQTTDGGYIITGSTNSFGSGGEDVYLIKTNSNGDTLWTKTYGGTNNDIGYCIQQTTDGGYIIAGYTQSFNSGGVYLIKTNVSGDTLWTKTYSGGSSNGNSVQQTTDGGYVIVGGAGGFSLDSGKVYLIKTNSVGDTLWTRCYGGTNYDWAYSVQQTIDGGYIIVGGCDSGAYLIKTDVNGNSGCNQFNPPTIIGLTNTLITIPHTQVSSGGIITSPLTQIRNGGTIITFCSSSGIDEIKTTSSISLYPNPTNGIFTLSYNSQLFILHSQFKIYDVAGREVYTQPIINQESAIINVSNLSNGIYFYQLINNTETYRGKFVIEK